MGAAAEGGADSSCVWSYGISDIVDAWMAGRREHGVACACGGSGTEYSIATFEYRSKAVYFIHFKALSCGEAQKLGAIFFGQLDSIGVLPLSCCLFVGFVPLECFDLQQSGIGI